jgi:hypothetical protein
LGLVFLSVIDDLQQKFHSLVYSCEEMRESLLEQLQIIFESYNHPDQLIPLIESKDYFARNFYYYFVRYDLT